MIYLTYFLRLKKTDARGDDVSPVIYYFIYKGVCVCVCVTGNELLKV